MRRRSILTIVGLVILLTACADGDTGTAPATTSSTETASLHPIPDELRVVTGTGSCDVFEDQGIAADGTPGPVYLCELEMSDPRVSGTQRDEGMRQIDGGADGFVWVMDPSVITNDAGAWRGAIQAADDAVPCGEGHYVGEDAYAGLELHLYFCGLAPVTFRGWITDR